MRHVMRRRAEHRGLGYDTKTGSACGPAEAWDASAEAGGRYTDQFVAAHDPQPVYYYDGVPAALVTL